MDDKQILDFYRNGDVDRAFNLIIREYGERLYMHIRHMTLTHDDADDCLQNTFVKVWHSLESFREESSLYTWLYRIATNETINFLRKQRIKSVVRPSDLASKLVSDPSFRGDSIQFELQKAIAKLPPRQKAVFVMRYYQDLPYKKISQILGVTESALKASYHFACEKIKARMLEAADS
ncbi:MAG: RNA polymerase sigma factor [Bacteroidales bacterium]|nr:RNA polymerase sigma factor [Candidatus Cacconaster merdequi]